MRFAGAVDLRALFRFAFEQAVAKLSSADLFAISRTAPGRVEDLGWLDPGAVAVLEQQLDSLARRPESHRFSVDSLVRRQLIALLGGRAALEDAQKMFVLAALLDRTFRWPPGDDAMDRVRFGVIPKPRAFFTGITNPPPALGQMTAVSICQRWMSNLWVVGEPRAIRGLGSLPALQWRKAAGRLRNRLEDACNKGRLRVGVIAPLLDDSTIRYHDTPSGCFAIAGFGRSLLRPNAERLLAHLQANEVDIAILPELTLDEFEFEYLRACLTKQCGRFPTLLVAGMAHRRHQGEVFVNEAVVLDWLGREVMRHTKLEPFTMADGRMEAILPRPECNVACLDTPVGRVVVNICRDVRSDVPMILNRLLGSSLVLVPAWSKRLDFLLEEARVLGARQGAVTVGSNLMSAESTAAGAFYAPVRGVEQSTKLVSSAEVAEARAKHDEGQDNAKTPGQGALFANGGRLVVAVQEFGFSSSREGMASSKGLIVL